MVTVAKANKPLLWWKNSGRLHCWVYLTWAKNRRDWFRSVKKAKFPGLYWACIELSRATMWFARHGNLHKRRSLWGLSLNTIASFYMSFASVITLCITVFQASGQITCSFVIESSYNKPVIRLLVFRYESWCWWYTVGVKRSQILWFGFNFKNQ